MGAEIEQELETMDGTRRGRLRRRHEGEGERGRDRFLPLDGLVVKVVDFLDVEGRRGGCRVGGDAAPDFGPDARVGDHDVEVRGGQMLIILNTR